MATQGRAEQPLTAQYEKLRANEKQAELWARISEVPYPESGLPTKDPGLPVILKLFLATYLWPALLHTSDELPEGRTKLIHPFGSVAKVYFNVSSDRCALHLHLELMKCKMVENQWLKIRRLEE